MSLLQSHLNTLLDTYDYNEIVHALENCILLRYNRALSNLEKMQETRLPKDAVIIEQEPGTKTLEIKSKEEQKKRQPKKLTPT